MNVSLHTFFASSLSSIKNIFQHLTPRDKTIIAIASVAVGCLSGLYMAYRSGCFFKAQPDVKTQDHSNRLNPALMQKLFKKYNYDINSLPKLDMTQFECSADYIKYIEPQHMTSPVMAFKDAWGREGIALHICGKNESKRKWSLGPSCNGSVSKISGVWTFHQRYSNNPSTHWVSVENHLIKKILDERHNETDHVGSEWCACPHCPIQNNLMSASQLEALLSGTDPDFRLGEEVILPPFLKKPEEKAPLLVG